MRAKRVLHAVDSHTEGMPTRVVVGGVGVVPGATMAERRVHLYNREQWWQGLEQRQRLAVA